MAEREFVLASAVALADLRPMTPDERRLAEEDAAAAWAWHQAGEKGPVPRKQVHCVGESLVDGPEHGVDGESTWCGIARDEVDVMRHTFHPRSTFACPECSRRFLAHVEAESLPWSWARHRHRKAEPFDIIGLVEPEEADPGLLVGQHVVEVGMRQVHPFLTFADPVSGREVRLYVDTYLRVSPDVRPLRQDDDGLLAALGRINLLTVDSARVVDRGLELTLDDQSVRIDGQDNELTTHDVWWIGLQKAADPDS